MYWMKRTVVSLVVGKIFLVVRVYLHHHGIRWHLVPANPPLLRLAEVAAGVLVCVAEFDAAWRVQMYQDEVVAIVVVVGIRLGLSPPPYRFRYPSVVDC